MNLPRAIWTVILALPAAAASGCHSYHVEMTVENRTGEPLQLLEVDYPSASFGKNAMATGEDYRYRIQVRGSGPIKVLYTTAAGQPIEIGGPVLAEGQEGRLEVVLLPKGKAEFRPELKQPQ